MFSYYMSNPNHTEITIVHYYKTILYTINSINTININIKLRS